MKNEKTSEWDEFTRRIYVNAPVSKIYECWATCKGITGWFLARSEWYNKHGKKTNTELAERGDTYEWQWVGNPFIGHGKVLKANGKDQFAFTFIVPETIVSIKLTKKKSRTLVELTQKHTHKTINARKINYHQCHAPWSYHLTNLKSILEGGIDLREPQPDMENLVNA